jgi:hypothetical protein
VTLDAASRAATRYDYRITESAQFSIDNPELRPRPVRGVGHGRGPGSANWIPAYSELLSVNGKRVLSVSFVVAHVSMADRRRAAIALSHFFYRALGAG